MCVWEIRLDYSQLSLGSLGFILLMKFCLRFRVTSEMGLYFNSYIVFVWFQSQWIETHSILSENVYAKWGWYFLENNNFAIKLSCSDIPFSNMFKVYFNIFQYLKMFKLLVTYTVSSTK